MGHGGRGTDWFLRRWGQDTSKLNLEGPEYSGNLNVNLTIDDTYLAIGVIDGNNPRSLTTFSPTLGKQTSTSQFPSYDEVNDQFKMGAVASTGMDNSKVKIGEVLYYNRALNPDKIKEHLIIFILNGQ